jgi:hypothetical protein
MNKLPFNVGDLVSIGWNYTYYDAQEALGVVVGGGNNAALVRLQTNEGLGKTRWISKEYLEVVSASR